MTYGLPVVPADVEDHGPIGLRPAVDARAGLPVHDALAMAPLRRRRARRIRLGAAALGLDMTAIAFGYFAVSLVYLPVSALEMVGRVLLAIAPVYLVLSLNKNSYSIDTLLDTARGPWRAALCLAMAAMTMFLLFFFLKASEEFSRVVLGFGTMLALLLLWLGRKLVARVGTHFLENAPFAFLHIHDGIDPGTTTGGDVAVAGDLGLAPEPGNPAMLVRLGELAQGLDGMAVHCPPERREKWAFLLKALDIPTEIIVPEISALHPLAIRERSGHASLVLGSGQLSWEQRFLKRSFDLAVTLAALPLLVPMLLLVALAVKLDSSGPVMFRQERIGLGNRKFRIRKFRTMRVEMEDRRAEQATRRDDPRVTRIGAFLRRTSLDELPQFLNVLSGEMSLVGPRPHAESTTAGSAMFWEVDSSYWHRHVVKPGMTGLAQVRGHRGSIFEEQQLRDRLNADLEYVANWSILGDVAIILRTAGVLIHKNAF